MDRTIDQLCYFVALTKSGLTDEVLRNLVAFVCALQNKPMSVADIQSVLGDEFRLQQPLPAIQSGADNAVEQGWLTFESLKYSSTPSGQSLLSTSQTRFDALEQVVRHQWTQAAEDVFGSLEDVDSLWEGVRAQLAVLVFRHGSSTAALLSDNTNLQPTVDGLQSELLDAAKKQCDVYGQEIVVASLTCFLQLETAESDEFIEHLLSSAFSYSALSIASDAAQYLSASLKPLDIFLDTNFIFGLLERHDSPQNQVCQELLRIARDNNLPFKFYFFEDTLRELNDWLSSQASYWLSGCYAPGVSRAMSQTEGVPLFVRRYHEENASEPLSVDMYLERFLNIGSKLESLGLTLFREPEQNAENINTWGERLASYEEFLKPRPKWKERSDSSLRHDAVLLGIIDRRRTASESPLTSRCLLLTIDSHLIAFSRARAIEKGERSFALYPSQLVQLVMPFIVHTERSSRVLAESINIAVFQTVQFDRQRAIASVSKYIRNIKNLSEEDAKRILSDQILLSRISLSADDEAGELVESALAAQTEEARKRQAEAEEELERVRSEKQSLIAQLETKEAKSEELSKQLGTEASAKGELVKTVETLEGKVQSLEQSRDSATRRTERRNEFMVAALCLAVGIGSWWLPLSRIPLLKAHANLLQLQVTIALAFILLALAVAIPKLRNWVWGVILGADIIFGIVAAATNKP